jgi:hypothetical protein
MCLRFPVLYLIFWAFICSGCIQKKSINGKEFVPEEVLIEVLVDLHLMDGITNDRKFHRRFDADSIDILNPILDKYNITPEMFDTTMKEYSRYPYLLDRVYNEVLVKLNVMLDENDRDEKPSTPEE